MPLNRSIRHCEYCSDEINIYEDEYHSCSSCDNYRCLDCGECECWEDHDDDDYRRSDSRVHSYDYRPHFWTPKGEFPMRPLMGVELEVHNDYNVDVIPDTVESIDPSASHLFVKEDGSLSSGLEIVSHPATLEWTRTYPWQDLLSQLQAEGCESPDGYGLHVHVSRNAFRRQGKRSPTHQLTWLLFLHRNPLELQALARRADDQWASFRKPPRGELLRKAHAHDGFGGGNRYVAVNCNNQRTYELRFFKSTLDYGEFMAAVEFADASVEYTRTLKTADILQGQALTWPHFTEWAERHEYPHLSDQIWLQHTDKVKTPIDTVVTRYSGPREPEQPLLPGCGCPDCQRELRRMRDEHIAAQHVAAAAARNERDAEARRIFDSTSAYTPLNFTIDWNVV